VRLGVWLGAVVVLAVSLAAAAWLWRARRAPPPPSEFHLVSTFPGSHRAPSFSPDGKMIAFVDDVRGVPQVWVRYVDQGDPLPITSGEVGAGRPRWSPKGDQILFERSNMGIWSAPPLGGRARQLLAQGSCPNFFPDGERLVFDRGPELWTARADGSEARRLDGVPTNYFSFMIKRCAAVSPDGRWIAYYQPERGPLGDLWVVAASGGPPRRLTSDSVEAGTPVWTPGGRFVVFSSARRGSRTLWRVPAEGGEPEAVTSGAGEDGEPDVSSDGRRLIYSNARNSTAVVVLDPATGAERTIVERRGHLNGPRFSPDGTRIAFFSAVDPLEQIFTVGVDGQDLRQITHEKREANVMPRWSGDGSFLYFYQQLPTLCFRKVPAGGGPSSTVIEGWSWEIQNGASVDPPGRRIVYSLYESGRLESARVRDLTTGQERELPRPLDDPQWSRDGRLVAGADPDANVTVCPADGGACDVLGKGITPCWSGDGKRIYFQQPGKPLDDPNLRSVELWVMSRDGSHPKRVAVLEPQHTLSMPFDVSVRGEIVWPQVRRGKRELWLAELPR
jgi:Tol biopolymer transport system component